ncbi:hypothetical protein AMS68_006289 [Peltaster fructicola]|uniref:Protein-lysine N-methyltransferase EFM5 n=1 Tax=Peltaster fructicola TaxID=286661 RepID=A0A6H0Y167_9PEZI|nr:hypothetical protein AMS68_006289 [Peltaster fructicola]
MAAAFDEDDEPLQLSADTLQALAEFRQEKSALDKRFEDLKAQAETKFEDDQPLTMDLFGEDWNASQFWYTDATAELLAGQLLADATEDSAIAIVSAPSVFVALKNILRKDKHMFKPRLLLLEVDRRFEVFGAEFQHYDYTEPLRLPASLKGAFDRLICDPPFLSEDCQTKTALTARFLSKDWSKDGVKLISCTGERMESTIHRLYDAVGVRTTDFEPEHRKGLSNEFRCFANFQSTTWSFRS